MNALEKIQYWLADRFKYFQYPNIQNINKPSWSPKGSSLLVDVERNSGNERLSFEGKIIVFFFSIFAFIIGASILFFAVIVIISAFS